MTGLKTHDRPKVHEPNIDEAESGNPYNIDLDADTDTVEFDIEISSNYSSNKFFLHRKGKKCPVLQYHSHRPQPEETRSLAGLQNTTNLFMFLKPMELEFYSSEIQL